MGDSGIQAPSSLSLSQLQRVPSKATTDGEREGEEGTSAS